MKEVVLFFPTSKALSDFIFSHEMNKAHVNSRDNSVTASFNEDDIIEAETVYYAFTMPQRKPHKE